jgi:hypothetical protein
MKASDVHAHLLTCPAPVRALSEFGEAVAEGLVEGTATVIYERNNQVHEGKGARLQRYWRRIEAAAQQGPVWSNGTATLPTLGAAESVRLTSIDFDEDAVNAFVALRRPAKPARGKRRIQDDWTPFWIAAIKLAKAEMLNVGTFGTSVDLTDRLHTMMGATLDEQTIKPFVAQIYKEVVEVPASKLQKACTPKEACTLED